MRPHIFITSLFLACLLAGCTERQVKSAQGPDMKAIAPDLGPGGDGPVTGGDGPIKTKDISGPGPDGPAAPPCKKVTAAQDRDIDLLFVIDNSPSMLEEQKNLLDAFSSLLDTLKSSSPDGKLPNLRVGVVSTDLGAGTLYKSTACQPGGTGASCPGRAP